MLTVGYYCIWNALRDAWSGRIAQDWCEFQLLRAEGRCSAGIVVQGLSSISCTLVVLRRHVVAGSSPSRPSRLCCQTKPATRLLLISFVRCLLSAVSYRERCRPPTNSERIDRPRWYVNATQCLIQFFLWSTFRSFLLPLFRLRRQKGSVHNETSWSCGRRRRPIGFNWTTQSLLREITNPATRMRFISRRTDEHKGTSCSLLYNIASSCNNSYRCIVSIINKINVKKTAVL